MIYKEYLADAPVHQMQIYKDFSVSPAKGHSNVQSNHRMAERAKHPIKNKLTFNALRQP